MPGSLFGQVTIAVLLLAAAVYLAVLVPLPEAELAAERADARFGERYFLSDLHYDVLSTIP